MVTNLFTGIPSQDYTYDTPQVMMQLLRFDSSGTIVLAGGLPANAVIIDITVFTMTAFNAGTTNAIIIGQTYSGGTNLSAYTAGTAIGPVGRVSFVPAGASGLPLAQPLTVTLNYSQTGTPATAGLALVVIRFVVP